jgi:uncharacterized RDD family membrane protein YckC
MKDNAEKATEYASLNRRLIASSIDVLLISLLLMPITQLLNAIFFSDTLEALFKENEGNVDSEELWLFISDNIIPYLTVQLISIGIMAAITIGFWIYKSQTIGKMITHCMIVDATTGDKPTKKQYIIRFFSYILSIIPLCIGFIVIYFTKKKQGWHDMLANTVVVVKKR